jgi:glycosyltransferase involved in cell wall biosynthesis
MPLVSIGLQFYNNEKTLAPAIQSILNQSFQDWELILHDDGSTDKSREIASWFSESRLRFYFDGVNLKRPARLNESLDLAKGKYYAVMDGDDIAYPDRLMRQIDFLEKHSDVNLLGAQMLVSDSTGQAIGRRRFPLGHGDICRNPGAGFPIAQPTFMGRIDWFRKHRYDSRALAGVEDQDLLLRAYRESRFANLPDILMGYRETAIYLKKVLRARYEFSRSLIRYFKGHRGFVTLATALCLQCTKGAIDCVAVGSGLKYRVLSQRSSTLNDEERLEWTAVRGSVCPGN